MPDNETRISASKDAQEFIKLFAMAFRQISLYGFDHQTVEEAMGRCHSHLTGLVAKKGNLVVNSVEGQLLIDGGRLGGTNPVYEKFAKFLEGLGIDSFTFSRGMTSSELVLFFRLMALKPEKLQEKGGIDRMLAAKGASHIKVNKVYYAKVGEGGEVVEKGSREAGDDKALVRDFEQEPKLEALIQKMVSEVTPDPELQLKLFELVMQRLQGEVRDKVEEATRAISDEKEMAVFQRETTEAVVDSMASGVVVVDDDGKIIMMNQTAQNLLDEKRVGSKINEDLKEELMVVLSREFSSGEGKMGREIDVASDDDTKDTITASAAIVQDKKGRPIGIVTTLNDITRQKELLRMRENFVSSVSHELRTPLAIIKQNISILLDGVAGDINDKQSRVLTLAGKNVERLSRLVNDVLDMAKLKAGKMTLHTEACDLEEVVDEIVETYKGWAGEKGITLTSQQAGAYPCMLFDRDKIIQVLTNLVSNALKFTGEGGEVTIMSKFNPAPSGVKGTAGVAVKDTGGGIAEDDLGRVFEEFQQAGGKSSADIKGTGLGLPISRKIVELHKGRIWAESELGKGSTFAFTLPVQLVREEKEAEEHQGILARLLGR